MIRVYYKVIGDNSALIGHVLYEGEDRMEATRIYYKELKKKNWALVAYDKLEFYKFTTELLMEWSKQGDEEND